LWITGKSIDVWQTISNAFVALLLAFSFQPLKRFFDKITNRIFYKDRYHTDEFYSRLNDALTLNTNLRGILKRASKEIASTLKCQQVFFFVNKMDGQYVSEGTLHHNHLSKDDATKISEYFGNNYHAIAVSTMDPENPIRNLLLNRGIEILIPLVQADETVGYLCLGENMSTGYTGRDIKVLNIITDEIVIAVQNALAVQKIFDFNSTLQKKVRDATKELRIKNTQLKQLDKAKDEFVSVAAHELRTPMTVFRGFVNLMLRKSLGPITLKQKDVLDKMNDNTKNLIDMVNNMLDLSKLEANKLVITLSDNYLDEMISETFDKIAFLYSSKGVELKREGDNVSINTDPEKFERVLLNLLSNAYKFTPVGGSVSVITSIDNAASEAVICVSDTGVGIPEDGIAKLFKKFSQVENALQKMSAGTGLGLSICKQMVEKMNGKIWVESQVGIGSKFYFTMPLSKTDTQN
ncbi:GAF domain-containing sensor histidine kinase, partial [Candidatus Saccharibacteria bacterium]|nr:GAF domain-containing sensor histidine kinase [Candidatus Saccharibacteria bacterium]